MENSKTSTYIWPAEWHPQYCIQLTWPHEGTDWRECLDEITETFIQLISIIATYEKVVIVAPDITGTGKLLKTRITKAEMQKNIFLFQCPTNDTWNRDHGGIVLTGNRDGGTQKASCRFLDFKFNGWGEKFTAAHDNAINRQLYSTKWLAATYEDHNDFVLEGGSIESDGKGTVFTTSQCLLAPHRNQPLGREDIEQELKHRLHAQRIVWLDHGNLVGDDTDGHIDTIVRTAPDDTLIYIRCDNPDDEQYEDFTALEKQLEQLKTCEGKPYKLLALPMPDAILHEGERLPATYANFLIINDAVICPTYDQEEKDNMAMATLRSAFAGRKVIGLDSRTIIRQHGSIHCLTMQFPVEATPQESSIEGIVCLAET